jgi:hypothetical protein
LSRIDAIRGGLSRIKPAKAGQLQPIEEVHISSKTCPFGYGGGAVRVWIIIPHANPGVSALNPLQYRRKMRWKHFVVEK